MNIASEQNDAALAALKGDQIDVAGSDIALLPAITGDLEPYLQPVDTRLTHLMTCKSEGPLSNVAARKAVSRAIDREAVRGNPEAIRFPLYIAPSTYAAAAMIALVSGLASALLVRRKLDHLDLIGVLKSSE